MLLGLADYLQLALISVSFDSALSLLSPALSLPQHAACWAHFLLRHLLALVWAEKSGGEFGAQTAVLEDLPIGASFRRCLVLSWGLPAPGVLPRLLWLFPRTRH